MYTSKTISKLLLGVATMATAMTACAPQASTTTASGLDTARFDTIINDKPVKLFVLKNANKAEVCVTNFGARVVSIMMPDKNNELKDVVLGFDNIHQYADSAHTPSDFGAAIGRYANRIDKGHITVGGKQIQLPTNNYGHCLHGGPSGWQYSVYEPVMANDSCLKMTLLSPDGDNNFPGNVKATVTYTLKSDNTLDMTFEATTDKETVVNMTNHSYFNLNGAPSKPGTDMVLYINADRYTPCDSTFMTTGEIKEVKGTPMDFTQPHAIAPGIDNEGFEQIKNGHGYDHNWVLNTYADGKGDDTKVAASLYSPLTGIFLEVYTNEPGIQCYTGNFLDGTVTGKHGITYPKRASVCLETQKFPDSPNKPQFVSPYLKPGQKYYSHVAYKFSIK